MTSRCLVIGVGVVALLAVGCDGMESPGSDPTEEVEAPLSAPTYYRITAAVLSPSQTVSVDAAQDWIYWGLSTTAPNRKANVTAYLSNYTKVGSGNVIRYAYTGTQTQFNWTTGTPTASATTRNGIATTNVGTGMSFLAPIHPIPRTVRVYATLLNGTAKIDASGAQGAA